MLYPQYLDHPKGTIGVMETPPRFVHFSGAVTTYRFFRYQPSKSVGDEIFRLLSLALLEELIPDADGIRALPTVAELSRGLTDPSAPVTYNSPVASNEYPIFRQMIEDLCESPIIQGSRAETLRELIRPFDEHFQRLAAAIAGAEPTDALSLRGRKHGLV
jgi:hypothetical protein